MKEEGGVDVQDTSSQRSSFSLGRVHYSLQVSLDIAFDEWGEGRGSVFFHVHLINAFSFNTGRWQYPLLPARAKILIVKFHSLPTGRSRWANKYIIHKLEIRWG